MIIPSILFFTYLFTIVIFVINFDKVKEFISKNNLAKTNFSIIIPFRNESQNLPKLLASIKLLKYQTDLVEFLFIDDNSDDNSVSIIEEFSRNNNFNFQILKNARQSYSPKKDAITTALKVSTNEWIITTDADCTLPKNWLKTFDDFIQQNQCNMIVAPVTYITKKTFLHQFQLLDFLSLQAATISGFGLEKPFLCNGANLAYKKDIFNEVNGFENNNSIASGDDVFLLEKFLQVDKTKVLYLKSRAAIVKTSPVNTVYDLINQRVRWASKTVSYNLFFGKLIGLIILLGNSIIVLLPLLVFLNTLSITTALSYLLLKLVFDYLLLKKVSFFYNQNITFPSYFCNSILYPFFTLLVVLKSIFCNYNWKGRTFKK